MVKDQEFLEKKASYCLGLAKKLGATDSSVVVKNSVSETVNFRNSKLNESNRSDDRGISITTYVGKKKSSISSSNFLFLKLTVSETEFFTITLESVAPNFFAKPKQYDAFVSKNS